MSRKKSKKIGQVMLAATMATSVFAVTNTADAASVSEAEKAVVKAEKLAGALKWEVSYEYRATKYPNNAVGYPNMKLHNDTKKALADAKKAVAALKGKEKEVLQTRLDNNVATYLNRSVAFIDAVTAGLKTEKLYLELKAQYDNGIVNDQTEKLYHQITKQINKSAAMLYRVYGVTTRDAFNTYYKTPGEELKQDLIYPVSIKIEIDRAQKALADKNYSQAASYIGNVDFFVKDAEKVAGLEASNKLIQSSLSELADTQKKFAENGILYVSNSTDADAPTVFGPASGSESTDKTVYLYAGNNEHIKLQNLSIDGNLVILGGKNGAGTVHLENVKVNKVNNNSGSVIVEDIAEHSLYMKGVEAESLVINDANGSNLVADEGVKVKKLLVSEKAGAKGSVTLESKAKGAFEEIEIAAKGSEESQGVALKGDLSETAINITGENANLAVGAGAVVKEIKLSAPAKVAIAEGSTVQKVKKDPKVTGPVEVDNKGTVKEAEEGIEVGGKAPEVVVPPEVVTPPAPTPTPGGGDTVVTPTVTDIYIYLTNSSSLSGLHRTITFTDSDNVPLADSIRVTGIQVDTNKTTGTLKLTSLTALGSNVNWIDSRNPLEYPITNGSANVTIGELLGNLDTGGDGISLGNLRAVFSNQDVVIKGKVESGGLLSNEITITLNFASTGVPATSFENSFVKIEKQGNNTALVTIKDGSQEISGIGNENIDFVDILTSLSSISIDKDLVELAIGARVGRPYTEVTLGDIASLEDKTFVVNGYTITFASGN